MPKVGADFFVPDPHASPNVRGKELTVYTLVLDEFATKLMSSKGNGRPWRQLPFLCFGDYAHNTIGFAYYSYELEPMCYVPAGNIDQFGAVTARAVRTTRAEAQNLEPRADHLFAEYSR